MKIFFFAVIISNGPMDDLVQLQALYIEHALFFTVRISLGKQVNFNLNKKKIDYSSKTADIYIRNGKFSEFRAGLNF